jgi:hypothetical protein
LNGFFSLPVGPARWAGGGCRGAETSGAGPSATGAGGAPARRSGSRRGAGACADERPRRRLPQLGSARWKPDWQAHGRVLGAGAAAPLGHCFRIYPVAGGELGPAFGTGLDGLAHGRGRAGAARKGLVHKLARKVGSKFTPRLDGTIQLERFRGRCTASFCRGASPPNPLSHRRGGDERYRVYTDWKLAVRILLARPYSVSSQGAMAAVLKTDKPLTLPYVRGFLLCWAYGQ